MSVRSDFTPQRLNAAGSGLLPGLLGVEIISIQEGELRSRMQLTKSHLAANGFLHAASIIALADTSCGNAAMAHIPSGAEGFTTVELKSNHLGTVREGAISCTARAQHLGRSTQVWDADVYDEETGKIIAMFRCTQMVLWPKG